MRVSFVSSHHEIFVGNQGDNVQDGDHSEHARHPQEVDLLRVAERQDQDQGAQTHGEHPIHVPEVAEVVPDERGQGPVELIANDDEERDGRAEAVDHDDAGREPTGPLPARALHGLLDCAR